MRNYLLLTPGPLSTSESVRQAMMQDWCTWDDDYNAGIVTDIRQRLQKEARTGEAYTTVLMQGSGTFVVEAVIGSAIGSTDKLLIISNGSYGNRMGTICHYLKLDYILIKIPETQPVTPEKVKEILKENTDITHVALVHCETTTGILNPLEELAKCIKGRGLTLIVDAMSSFGGIPIEIEAWDIDFLISSANKCIQGVPGFGFVIAKRNSLEECKGKAASYSLDIYDQWMEMEKGRGKWRFTSPTHVVRAFHQALRELEEEGGIQARYQRYSQNHRVLLQGMKSLGFTSLLPEELMSPIITSFLYPDSMFDFKEFYNQLKEKGFVIYPGKISEADTFRIGNIGDVYPDDFERLAQAVAETRRNQTQPPAQ